MLNENKKIKLIDVLAKLDLKVRRILCLLK